MKTLAAQIKLPTERQTLSPSSPGLRSGLKSILSQIPCLPRTSVYVCECVLSLCDSTECGPPGSSVHGIFQATIRERLSFPTAGNLPNPGTELVPLECPALAGGFFTTEPPGKLHNVTLFGNRAFVHVMNY